MGKDQELLEAARNGHFSVVEKILFQKAKRSGPLASLRRGPGANVQDSSGYSSLHHAALNGHKDIVEVLLSNEASTNIVDGKGSSPLHLAAWSGNVDIVRMLLCHGPSIPNVNLMTKDNETALHCAAQYGHTEVVCLLLEHSCDPTIRNTRQETALDLAAQYGRLETVDMLVRTHPELIQPYNGRSSSTVFPHSPLHLASRNGHKAVVEVLLSGGMNVNVRTAAGTALHEAALCGKTEVVRTLLERGIDLSLRDTQNNTVTDILKQFPCHVVHDIYSIIKKYRNAVYDNKEDSSVCISVPSLGSPYDNAANSNSAAESVSPNSTSPMHYDIYERRYSGSCSVSLSSDGMYSRYNYNNTAGFSKSILEPNFLSDDMSYTRSRDFDTLSVCSTTSSNCSRDRRSPHCNNPSTQLSSPGSISNKISPTPPKKPPRRNLSISPTHISPHSIAITTDQNGYDSFEHTFFKQSQKLSDVEETQMANGNCKNRETVLRRGKSAEHYLDTKFRHSVMIDAANDKQQQSNNTLVRGKSEDLQLLDSKFQPIAITSLYGNIPYRTTNPRRKLRRQNNEHNVENYDPSFFISRGDLPFKKVECESKSPITVERILVASGGDYRCHSMGVLRSSRENLLEEQKNNCLKKPLSACPLSPTHYQQPPTPDHPPPTAVQAENRIHDRIRPLSQEYSNLKRKSRDIETETEEELLLLVFPSSYEVTASSGSLSSSVSLSDKSVSTENNTVEEFIGDAPFAGCGVSVAKQQNAQRRIVGGDEAGFGSFPWQAYVRIGSSRCGGTLVNRYHVVTAGHCVARATARQVQVTLGDYVINSAVEPLPAYTFGVRKINVHPYFKFTPQADRFDVAVLRLDRPVQYMPHISPICLPEKDEDFLGQYGWAAGWGALQAGSRLRPKTLQAVDVPIIDNRQCERWHKSNGINVVIYEEMMCAGYRGGNKDSCQGDSGGPLMFEKTGRWYLIGIVSAGYSCAQRGQPGIYHRVAHTVDWISYIVNS